MIELGSPVELAVDVFASGGGLVDPQTATLTVTLPDGTTATPVVPLPSTVGGQLRVAYAPTQVGHYSWQMVTTGPVTAYGDVFNVEPAASPAIMSLASAKKHLNITGSQDDDELRFFMAATTRAVENTCGQAVARRTVVQQLEFWTPFRWFLLSTTPLLSVTSLVRRDAVQSWSPADFDIDLPSGKLTLLPSGLPVVGQVLATYEAGMAVIPTAFQLAADIVLKHMWETQRGAMGAPMGDSDGGSMGGMGYSVPNRAKDLLGGHLGGV